MIAIVLPLQGALLAVALYIADSTELWFWGIFTSAGAVIGTIVLLTSGLHDQPGVYLTLRAEHIQLDQHPKLSRLPNRAPLPRAILVGLQARLFSTTRTVFCPDGELEGGVLCLSLPASFVLSVAEFRALVGEALLRLQKDLSEGRAELLSSTEAANGVLSGIDDTMQQWSWWPRFGFHPAVLVFWFVLIASMRLPLYLGKELLTYYLTEFWTSRHAADLFHSVEAHDMAADDVGTIQVISALVKEAALNVGSWRADAQDAALRALGEILTRVLQDHPKLKFDRILAAYDSPATAWRYLQYRCSLSGVNLEWCRQIALEVSPEPSAASLFENAAAFQARLEELWESPFVRVRR